MSAPSDPLTQEAIDAMLVDADPDQTSAASYHAVCRYHLRALAAEVKRLRASRPEWQKCRQEQIEAIRERDQARADLERWKTATYRWRSMCAAQRFAKNVARADLARAVEALTWIRNQVPSDKCDCDCCRLNASAADKILAEQQEKAR